VQEAWTHITLPHCFGTKPRDPVHSLNHMKMEEVTNLLWIGFIMSEQGPTGFRKLWTHLHQAAKHYLYDFNGDQQKAQEAAMHIKLDAEELESLITAELVRNITLYVNSCCRQCCERHSLPREQNKMYALL
jgi:hypothetical protein